MCFFISVCRVRRGLGDVLQGVGILRTDRTVATLPSEFSPLAVKTDCAAIIDERDFVAGDIGVVWR